MFLLYLKTLKRFLFLALKNHLLKRNFQVHLLFLVCHGLVEKVDQSKSIWFRKPFVESQQKCGEGSIVVDAWPIDYTL